MFLRFAVDFLRRGVFGAESAEFGLVLRIEIGVIGRDRDVDFAAWLEIRRGELLRRVVAFGAPGDIVRIAEGVDVEDVDVSRGQQEVLNKTRNHMPRIQE